MSAPYPSSAARFPIQATPERVAALSRLAEGIDSGFSRIDGVLAKAILRFIEGRTAESERSILAVLRHTTALRAADVEAFISVLTALFLVQRLDLVATMLQERHGFSRNIELVFEERGAGPACVRWDIAAGGEHRFAFDASVLRQDHARLEILAFHWIFPLLVNYAAQPHQEVGSVLLNRADIGLHPGLAYCHSRPDYFLIPDCVYVPTRGYEYARRVLSGNSIPWDDRSNVAFWRGATTGVPVRFGDWRSLERIKLCELAQRYEHTKLLDIGISSIAQFDDARSDEIRRSGLMREAVPWENWGRFKYLIDIDGNSSPWSNLFQRLLTGSTVMKVESTRGLRQWFYDELIPWHNYVPVAPDLSDLVEKIEWLEINQGTARTIGQNGLELAARLNYERELRRSVDVISSAFRYFRGERGNARPFGRVVA
jgi:Glycosyl transferase family 90